MKGFLASFLFLGILLGCLGPGINTGNTNTDPSSDANASGKYLLSSGTGSLHSFKINTNGTLSFKSKFDNLSNRGKVTIHPSGQFVYMASLTNAFDISFFTASPSEGTLSQNSDVVLNSCSDKGLLAIAGSGKYLIAKCGVKNFKSFSINPTTGEVNASEASSGNTTGNISNWTTSHNGTFLHILTSSQAIETFGINPDNGSLLLIESFGVPPTQAIQMMTLLDGFLYFTENAKAFYTYSISSSGNLTILDDPAQQLGEVPTDFNVTSDTRFVYTLQSAGGILGYSLTSGKNPQPLNGGNSFPNNLATGSSIVSDPGKKFVFVADESSQKIFTYSVNSTTGDLSNEVSIDEPSATIAMKLSIF